MVWAIAARVLGVATVVILIGAMVADIRKAFAGTLGGMIVADLLYVVIGNYVAPGGLEAFVLNPLMLLCVFPGAAAASGNRKTGLLVGMLPVLMTTALTVVLGVVRIAFSQEVPGGIGLALVQLAIILMLIVPLLALSAAGWLGGIAAIHLLGLKNRPDFDKDVEAD